MMWRLKRIKNKKKIWHDKDFVILLRQKIEKTKIVKKKLKKEKNHVSHVLHLD